MGNNTFQGDLADVVRASCSSFFDDLHLPLQPSFEELSAANQGFGDPFSSTRDPFVVEFNGIEGMVSNPTGDVLSADKTSPLATCDVQIGAVGSKGMIDQNNPRDCSFVSTDGVQISSAHQRNQMTKKRKSQAKRVICIPAPTEANSSRPGGGEVVPSDLWAWRKYGQKPIKGSPYPRGYYRCSSSKGCLARKQVERSRSDPNMLVITYTSEHNHPWPTQRNALSGSTRTSTTTTSSSSALKPPSSPPPPPAALKEEDDHRQNHKARSKEKFYAGANQYMNQMFDYDESYRPVLDDEVSEPGRLGGEDMFSDLRELEADDPPHILFSQDFRRGVDHGDGGGSKSFMHPFSSFV